MNVPPTSTPMRFMPPPPSSAGTIASPDAAPSARASRSGTRPRPRRRRARPAPGSVSRHRSGRPGDREVVDELAGQVARVLGRRVEVALRSSRTPRRAPRRAGSSPRACRARGSAASRRRCGSRTRPAPSGTPPTPPPGRPRPTCAQKSGDLDLVRVAARLLGAGADVLDRPAHGRRVGRRRRSSRCRRARRRGAGSSARSRDSMIGTRSSSPSGCDRRAVSDLLARPSARAAAARSRRARPSAPASARASARRCRRGRSRG